MNIEVDFKGTNLELSKPLPGYYTWQEARDMGSEGWRLPTITELKNLWSEAKEIKYVFEDTSICWSSSPVANLSYGAWLLYFSNGYDDFYSRSSCYHVRLVKEV